MNQELSHQDIDALFQTDAVQRRGDFQGQEPVSFDFRKPDRIPKSQLRAIHMLHDTFAHNLVSSLSAYLRTYLVANLISVEQLSCAEFLDGLPSPTCMLSLGLRPYDGNAVLELNSALVFPILEILLGGDGKSTPNLQRETTEIEQKLLDGLFRLILRDLKEAWKGVSTMDFTIESIETEPQFLRVLAPSEAVVAISIEIRIGDNVGMMNIAMPSINIKMMRQKFDHQWAVRRSQPTDSEQAQVLELLKPAALNLDVRLQGPTLSARDLLQLQEGDLLVFDFATSRPVDLIFNGKLKFQGHVVNSGRKKAFQIEGSSAAPETSVH